ncbi:DUF202 domain-containing protein [Mycobacterium numidiamassiliense]|uniref:DUF202 domain-containing protein n=1 Tax=Mycobacterium numidiamassiliense TaxID=1841861 RepID=UPI00097DAA64|nr:DUF202 domain-containing protein [Mycobacterium numidiamassiliense]
MTRPGAANSLPAERTILAWTRTSFAFLVNGVLLSIKNLHGHERPTTLMAAGIAVTAAVCCYVIALRRQRVLQLRPLPARITPRRQVYLVGIATMVLITVTTIAQQIH